MVVLFEDYKSRIVSELMKNFGYTSVMQVPKITKITLNMGVGEAINDKKIIGHAVNDMIAIAGQKPIVTKVKKSVAGFKIRDGWPIGCKVTLRGNKMYDFLQRLIHIALPRVRDFRGLNLKGFDGQGNYNFGIQEQIVFAEIEYDKIDAIRGLNVSLTTNAKTDEEAVELLRAFDFPLIKKKG